jgi:hypothetical protein
MRGTENVVRNGENSILVEKPVGKRPLGRHRRRWQNNIKTELKELCLMPASCWFLASLFDLENEEDIKGKVVPVLN